MGMLMLMVLIISYQVFMRYVFNHSPSWSEEIALLLMVWFGILSIPIGVKLHLHIGIEFIYRLFPDLGQYVISRLVYLLIMGFGLIMIVYGMELTSYMNMSTLPATKLSSSVQYAVIPISGLLLIFNSLELFFIPYLEFLEQNRLEDESFEVG